MEMFDFYSTRHWVTNPSRVLSMSQSLPLSKLKTTFYRLFSSGCLIMISLAVGNCQNYYETHSSECFESVKVGGQTLRAQDWKPELIWQL